MGFRLRVLVLVGGYPVSRCSFLVSILIKSKFNKGSVYSYNNFQQIVVRIAANLILTTNDITESIQ